MSIRSFAAGLVFTILLLQPTLRADGPMPKVSPTASTMSNRVNDRVSNLAKDLAIDPARALANDPSTAPTIDPLPAGWTHKDDTAEKHQGENAEAKAYFEVTGAEKAIPFEAWCKKMAAKEDKDSPIMNPKITELKPGKIGDYEVMSYETTGTVFLSPVHTRMYFVVLPSQYARLLCTGMEEHWSKVEGQLDELVKNMK